MRRAQTPRRQTVVRAAAAAQTSTIVQTLQQHFERLQTSDADVARLRTALAFYASAPRVAALASPDDVAGAFQNARWRSTCHTLMDKVAKRLPATTRGYLLLRQGSFAMRLDQRLPMPNDAAQAFLRPGPVPRFDRESVPVLEVFKTELAALDVARFDTATCAWLRRVSQVLNVYEDAEARVALADPACVDLDIETLVISSFNLRDTLEDADRPTLAALGGPRTFERARDRLARMCLQRVDELEDF